MRAFLLLLLLGTASALAGTAVISETTTVYDRAPHIPNDVLLGIKRRAELYHPGQPDLQMKVIWIGIDAYLALQRVPSTPDKRQAAEDFPYDYPKQLYLAERPFWH